MPSTASFTCRVCAWRPAAVELLRPLVRRVALEPHRLDHAAALRRRCLLVLAGDPWNEVSGGLFADRAPELFQHLGRQQRRALAPRGVRANGPVPASSIRLF